MVGSQSWLAWAWAHLGTSGQHWMTLAWFAQEARQEQDRKGRRYDGEGWAARGGYRERRGRRRTCAQPSQPVWSCQGGLVSRLSDNSGTRAAVVLSEVGPSSTCELQLVSIEAAGATNVAAKFNTPGGVDKHPQPRRGGSVTPTRNERSTSDASRP